MLVQWIKIVAVCLSLQAAFLLLPFNGNTTGTVKFGEGFGMFKVAKAKSVVIV